MSLSFQSVPRSTQWFFGTSLLAAGLIGFAIPTEGAWVLLWVLLPVAGVILISQPKVGVVLVAATIPLESITRVGEGLTAAKILGMAVFGAWLCGKLLRRESWAPIWSNIPFNITLTLLALGIVSTLWAKYPTDAYLGLFQLFQMILWTLLIVDWVNSWDRAVWLMRVVVIAAVGTVILTLAQYFGAGVARAGGRIAGGINKTSALMVTIVPLAFCLIRSQARRWRPVGLLYLMLSPLAVLVTFSRQSYLFMPLAVLPQYWHTLRGRAARIPLLVVTSAILVVGFVALSQGEVQARLEKRMVTIAPYLQSLITGEKLLYDETQYRSSARGFHWRVGLAIFEDHPLFGAGYNNYGPLFVEYQFRVPGFHHTFDHARSAHSSHIRFLADLGMLGFALWLLLLGTTLGYLMVSWRRLKGNSSGDPFLCVQGVTYCVLLQIAYGFTHEIHEQKLFWLMLALSIALYRVATRHQASLIPNDNQDSLLAADAPTYS